MPTAARVCFPLSPKTSTIKSEQPLTTLGWSVKFGAALTIPVTLRTLLTFFKSPTEALTVEIKFIAVILAASYPCSIVKS